MARVRVQFSLCLATEADAIALRDAINGDLAGRALHGSTLDASARIEPEPPDVGPPWCVSGNLVLDLKAEGDGLFDLVADRIARGAFRNRLEIGSWVQAHDCPHTDEPSPWPPCNALPSLRRTVR